MHLPEIEIAASLPPPGCPVAQAEQYTHWLATHHYENFHVVSWLLPRRLRKHFYMSMPTAAGRTISATKWEIPFARSSCSIGGRVS